MEPDGEVSPKEFGFILSVTVVDFFSHSRSAGIEENDHYSLSYTLPRSPVLYLRVRACELITHRS